MDAVLVVDVEATCWKGRQPPKGEQSEIIEIGICTLNLNSLEPGPTHSILVKPQRSKISPFCTGLTSITPQLAAQGILFNEACARLRCEFATQNGLWTSWGHFDRRMFERQCRNFNVDYPFGPQHVNLKKRLAILLRGSAKGKPRQIGLMRAMEMMKLEFEGAKHRAGSDAWNTARLLAAIIRRYGHESVLAT